MSTTRRALAACSTSNCFIRTSGATSTDSRVRLPAQEEASNRKKVKVQNYTYTLWEWGHGNSRYVNKSCGVAVSCKSPFFAEKAVREVSSAPNELQGRGGGVHYVRSHFYDVAPMVAYFSPSDREANRRLMAWLIPITREMGSHTIPILWTDLNDGLGKTGDRPHRQGNHHIGPSNPKTGSPQGPRIRNFPRVSDMKCANTSLAAKAGPTYFGYMWDQKGAEEADPNISQKNQSRPDYIIVPVERIGQIIQRSNSIVNQDHILIRVEVRDPLSPLRG